MVAHGSRPAAWSSRRFPPGYGLAYAGPGTSYQRPDTRI